MKNTISLFFCFFVFFFVSCSGTKNENDDFTVNQIQGDFKGYLTTNTEGVSIPVRLFFLENEAYFVNDTDTVKAQSTVFIDDSLFVTPMLYNTVLNLEVKNGVLKGDLVHLDIDRHTPIYFLKEEGELANTTNSSENNFLFANQWKAVFSTDNKRTTAIGVFDNKDEYVAGNFRTETGDYRFLQGQLKQNTLWLSSFDGAHAYYLEAKVLNDTLVKGSFYSGPKVVKDFEMTLDSSFYLADPNSMTKMINPDEVFNFKALELNGDTFEFDSHFNNSKLTMIQVMGSWCPNCMDETNLFTKLYDTYHAKGLDVLGVSFERSADIKVSSKFIERMKGNLNIKYPVFFGGKPNKEFTSKVFNQLTKIRSYPTTIIVDENHKVVKIHTGFNGPATGDIYQMYVAELKELIESYL